MARQSGRAFGTAGHVLGTEERLAEVEVQFLGELPRGVQTVAWRYDEERALDFAILKLKVPIAREPLPISLMKRVAGGFRLCGYGTTLKEASQYSGEGQFSGSMYVGNSQKNHLFRLRGSDLGQEGNSGGAVFSLHPRHPPQSKAEATFILNLAGAHPFFIQIACYHLFNAHLTTLRHAQGTAPSPNLSHLERDFMNDAYGHYNYAWQQLTPEQQDILLALHRGERQLLDSRTFNGLARHVVVKGRPLVPRIVSRGWEMFSAQL